jgi:hypothetical protein
MRSDKKIHQLFVLAVVAILILAVSASRAEQKGEILIELSLTLSFTAAVAIC